MIRITASTAALRLLFAVAVGAVLFPGSAFATCRLNVMDVTSTQWTGGHNRGYDVYDPQRRTQLVTFHVQTPDGNCQYFITVAPTSGPGGYGMARGPGGSLRYDVFKDGSASQLLKAANIAGPSEVLTASAAAGRSTAQFQFAFVIWPEQIVLPGTYVDEIEISVYEGQLGSGILRDRRHVSVTAPVPTVAEISFSEGAGFDPNYSTYTVNFSLLRPGDRRLATLKARSNGGYRIMLSSVNGGTLRHTDPSDDSRIPYTLIVDGGQVTLPSAGTVQAILNSNVSPAAGQQHLLEFRVGDISGASAGDYRDVVNISVFSLR